MPKSKIQLPDRRMINRQVKFKLGNRQSLVSALTLSTEKLLEIANDSSAGKKRQVAAAVLSKRGVQVMQESKELV